MLKLGAAIFFAWLVWAPSPPALIRDSIAFDHAAYLGNNGGSLTASFTVGSGSHRILFVFGEGTTGSDDFTGATYNGVSMTQVEAYVSDAFTRATYLYCLENPASGAHNVVISTTGNFVLAIASAYTGAAQTCTVDAHGHTSGNSDPLNLSLTTTADNVWGVYSQRSSSSGNCASPATQRAVDTDFNSLLACDSGPLTPPGSQVLGITTSGVTSQVVGATFAPFTTGPSFPSAILGIAPIKGGGMPMLPFIIDALVRGSLR